MRVLELLNRGGGGDGESEADDGDGDCDDSEGDAGECDTKEAAETDGKDERSGLEVSRGLSLS